MIVPMKKVAVFIQSKDAQPAVRQLRSLGVLHLEHQKPPKGKDINSLEDEIKLLDRAIEILNEPEIKKYSTARSIRKLRNWRFAAKRIIDMHKRREQLIDYSAALGKMIGEWEDWGDFDPRSIHALGEKGVHIGLYRIPVKEIGKFPEGAALKIISCLRGAANCAVISREKVDAPFQELAPPKMGLKEMRARLDQNLGVIKSIRDTLKKHAFYLERFLRIKEAFTRELEFHEALRGMGEAKDIAYVTGYAPYDETEKITRAARKEKWGIFITEPSEEDNVPTFIRNPRWVSVIAPVFRLIEIVPGYRELDISPLFLCFLGLFFGMIIGDAGYGAVYFSLTFLAHKTFGRKVSDKRVFFLFYFFSSCAIFWGVLTGTVFGQEWCFKMGLRPLIPVLNDTKFLQAFCFFLGAFHLTLGHAWQAARKMPSITALADLGWILVLWAAFFLAKALILNDTLPFFVKWLIITGISLVILCSNPQRNIFKMVGQGLGTVVLSVMNNFTDVVSYVRLFAVGLAGIAISDTVNALALSLGNTNLIAKIAIIFLGHTVNILLGPISVLVHGVRLNVLEFSGHAGLTWSGISYRPLKE